jgi:hypothetical protein
MSLGPSCPIRPFFTKLGGTNNNTEVQGASIPEDLLRREARHVCSQWL